MGCWDGIRYLYGDGSETHRWYEMPEQRVWCGNPWTKKPNEGALSPYNASYDDGGGVPSWMQFLTTTPYAEPIPLVGYAKKVVTSVYTETLQTVPARRAIKVE